MSRWRRDIGCLLVVTATMSGLQTRPARAQLAPIDATRDLAGLLSRPRPLQLEVSVNGVPTPSVQPFVLTPPNHLAAQRQVLEAIGIAVEGNAAPDAMIDLDSLPEVTHRLDDTAQAITFRLPDGRRQRKTYDARGGSAHAPAPPSDWGAALNYWLFASDQYGARNGFQYSGANARLDARVFGPYGSFEQTLIAGDTPGSGRASSLRLETTYTLADQDRMLTSRVGDVISSGLAWTRPIRMGGVQVQRDFAVQPGIVTQPLPSIAGSAAIPSTVDVFVDSSRLYSQRVDAGPYQLVNIPNLVNGTGSVVVTDATGRQTRSSLPLYDVASLLRPGLTDFSVEAGLARRDFGIRSDDYDARPMVSATYRTGLTSTLTAQGHAEAGAGVVNAGGGVIAGTSMGTIEAALAVSREGKRLGAQAFAAYDVRLWGDITLHASTQFRTGAYEDLAGATARWTNAAAALAAALPLQTAFGAGRGAALYLPPKSLSQISAYAPLPFWTGSASISLIDQRDAAGVRTRIVAASLDHPLPYQASLFATAFFDVSHGGGGLLVGVSIPIGTDMSASAAGGGGNGLNGSFVAQKTPAQDGNGLGWQIADLESSHPERFANATYRSSYATAAVGLAQSGREVGGTASLEGSIATMGGAVAVGNRIDDGFAIVDAGIPNVEVLQDNRRIGTTDPWGHFLVSGLSAYLPNRIAIDPLTMPSQAEATSSESLVTPARSSGVRVDFGGERDMQSASIVVTNADGHPLAAGATGRLEGSTEDFVIGYGGKAYIRHLKASNAATVETAAGACHIAFPYDGPAKPEAPPRVVPCS